MFSRRMFVLTIFGVVALAFSAQAMGSRVDLEPVVVAVCVSSPHCPAKHPRIKRVWIAHQMGARPRWSPDGRVYIFDKINPDGFYDLYLSDFSGQVRAITDGTPGITQRHNGNGMFHPSGKFIVFVSETRDHAQMGQKWLADPGIGLYSNLWMTDMAGSYFTQLTDVPIKEHLLDRSTPVIGTVNPQFSRDGTALVWTERYDGGKGWGKWRIKVAGFEHIKGGLRLKNERLMFVPRVGNYVTSMGFIDSDTLLLSGNLDGQHEFGMDHYLYNWRTRQLRNIHPSPESWEEGACLTPSGRKIVFMSNQGSKLKLDFDDPSWHTQPKERDYYIMNAQGGGEERLTFFNDPSAPEYLGRRVITAACSISPDGRYLAGTLGVDFGNEKKAKLQLKVVMMEFDPPLQ